MVRQTPISLEGTGRASIPSSYPKSKMQVSHLGVTGRKVCVGISDMEEVTEPEIGKGCSGGNRAVKSQ